jgi:hypothetical protein
MQRTIGTRPGDGLFTYSVIPILCYIMNNIILAIYISYRAFTYDDDNDVYLDKLQTRGIKKFILYMWNVDQPIMHK